MVLLVALVVGATLGKLPPAVNPTVWMEALSRPLGRLAPLLVPALFGGAALLLGWVNAPDLLVMTLSVWLLAGCLALPGPDDGAAGSMIEPLNARFVAPLFYYALLGVPGAVLWRALEAAGARQLVHLLGFVPRWLAAAALAVAGRWRGSDEAWQTARLAAWIAAAAAALSLYPRHAFLL
jgi:cobalamin biosynthesis protein CobD/CbiB